MRRSGRDDRSASTNAHADGGTMDAGEREAPGNQPGFAPIYLTLLPNSASVEFGSQPKKSIWRAGGLEVSCNPEVGLRIDGRPTIVKLYPKQEKLAVRKVEPALALLQRTHGGDDRDVAVLDVRRSRLHTLTREIPGIDALLAAEAAAFLVMWRSL